MNAEWLTINQNFGIMINVLHHYKSIIFYFPLYQIGMSDLFALSHF